VGIVGAGPRGLTVLERLVAHTAALTAGPEDGGLPPPARAAARPVRIHVLDPHPPGPGRVWRTTQSPHLLMNTVVDEQTVFPDESCRVAHTRAGRSMSDWAAEHADEAEPDDEARPAPGTGSFARRRDYGRYLEWSWRRVRADAPAHVEIVHEPCSVHAVHDAPADAAVSGGLRAAHAQSLTLSDGRTLEVDAVVLCVGHIPAALSDERAEWQSFARDAGLTYLPPDLPAETPVDRLAAGETVLIRGFGLNYFDLQSLLSHGRGGTFEHGEDGLHYAPSGEEPILVPGSRRGVPYRSKPITPQHPLPVGPDTALRHFTPEIVDRLPVRGDGLRFDEQLWPLILADLRSSWYTVLQRTRPDAFRADPDLLQHALDLSVDRVLRGIPVRESERWRGQEQKVLSPTVLEREPDLAFDLRSLLRPLGDRSFSSREELDAALLEFLRRDLAAALAGPEASPLKSLFPVLWQARAFLKDLVAQGRISPDSFIREVRGWFEDFVSGLCDGPPPQRFAELIALSRAGLVRFAGPQVRITPSRFGEAAAFVATSPAVPGEIRARSLVDAGSPANRVGQADDVLVRGMLERGQLTVATHDLDDGTTVTSSGLAVTEAPYRTVDARGRVHPARFCLSIQLSSVQLRDADAVARAVLGLD
jgi:hypothetical protein